MVSWYLAVVAIGMMLDWSEVLVWVVQNGTVYGVMGMINDQNSK